MQNLKETNIEIFFAEGSENKIEELIETMNGNMLIFKNNK